MKFYISRTSDFCGEKKPCDEAICLNPNRNQDWENGVYGIEFNSLEDLLAFKKRIGEEIIIKERDDIPHPNTWDKDFSSEYEIEIYDSYRE